MAVAGYDPEEAAKLWERMKAAVGEAPPEFMSTHPSPANRVAYIKRIIREEQVLLKTKGDVG